MSLDTYSPQPNPTPGRSDVTALVVADLERRAEAGARKYGTRLKTHNGRRALIDLYQELLDGACYAKQQLEEECSIAEEYERAIWIALSEYGLETHEIEPLLDRVKVHVDLDRGRHA